MSELPTFKPGQVVTLQPGETITLQTGETIAPLPKFKSVSVTVPFITEAPTAESFQDEAHRVDMGNLSRERMRKLKALRRGLVASDVRMIGGAEVRTNRDALYCLLDLLDI